MANTFDNHARPFNDSARASLNTIAIEIRRMWVTAGGYTNVGLERPYTEQRAKNDKAKRSRATNRKGATMATTDQKPNAPGMDAQAIADLETSARARRLAEAIESLKMYEDHRIQPGGFLIAVLSNDLMRAVGQADSVSILALGDIAKWVYRFLPRKCWGSSEIVGAWLGR